MSSRQPSGTGPAGKRERSSQRSRDETSGTASRRGASTGLRPDSRLWGWVVLAVAGIIFLGTVSSPPSLLDDVDATYARIAHRMLESGDWVTARLNGIRYFDKPPGQVWAIAAAYSVVGVRDWAARIPVALAAMALCWLAWRTSRWAFGDEAGLYAGVGLATCCGLFLFTRVRIPDIYISCCSLIVLDCFLRSQEGRRSAARTRMCWAGAAIGAGVLFKGLVAAVLPLGAIVAYLLASGTWRSRETWGRLGLGGATAAATAVAAPWHVLATLQNPPILEFGLDSGPGQYRGFLWRYLVNEHALRYLGMRYPVDYDRVPLLWFWSGHLAWLFPWSGLLFGLRRLSFHVNDRAGRARLLMLCHSGFALLFFSASTTQEYYTLPIYAPVMLLLASTAVARPAFSRTAARLAAVVYAVAVAAGVWILASVRAVSPEGDIAQSLTSNPDAYTLSLGHFQDLTLESFAYLRGPLSLALLAFLIGSTGGWLLTHRKAFVALACASTITMFAAHWAMAVFDPHLSSRTMAETYLRADPGELILDQEYYAFSSVAFYADRQVLLLNGRRNNIEYGSNAPGAPDVFLDDAGLATLWKQAEPKYLVTYASERRRFETLLGTENLHLLAEAGDKVLLTNIALHARSTAGR